jgi:phenylpropionate dioxygenase-like ring-hydroxylating dioxygenase large terminal subunit
MIPNQWYLILNSREVRNNQVVGIKRLGENLVIWRDSHGKLGAAKDKCPHRGIALSKGKVKDDHLQCPFHGFEYDPSGKCKFIPATGKVSPVPDHIRAKTYPVAEAHGFIYLFWREDSPGSTHQTDPVVNLPWFDDLNDGLIWHGMTDHWKAHYSRVIENQLDVVHVPFIHHNTIGRGIGPIGNGPYIETGANSISFWPSNEQDHGQKPIPRSEMTKPAGHPHISLSFFPTSGKTTL